MRANVRFWPFLVRYCSNMKYLTILQAMSIFHVLLLITRT